MLATCLRARGQRGGFLSVPNILLLIICALGTAASRPASAQVAAARLPVSVHDFGAVGDGVADDTAAFQAAIAAAAQQPSGRSVQVPPGLFRITAPLVLDSMLLMGSPAGGWPADSRPLPTIIVDVPAPEAAIIAKLGASVHGIGFDFDRRGNEGRVFGPGILIAGGGVSVSNVVMHQPTIGISTTGSDNAGRVNLHDIFMVNAHAVGVRFAFGLDVITIDNVEVWNYRPELLHSTIGFQIGHADEIHISNSSVIGAMIGYQFIASNLPDGRVGSVWGGMTNCLSDFSGVGVQIETANVLRITNSSFWSHHHGVVVAGEGDVLISNTEIKVNSGQALAVKGGDSLTVTGVLFKKNPGWEQEPKVLLDGGKLVNITGSTFDGRSVGVRLTRQAGRVGFTGNIFAASPYRSFIDESSFDTRKLIEGNLFGDR